MAMINARCQTSKLIDQSFFAAFNIDTLICQDQVNPSGSTENDRNLARAIYGCHLLLIRGLGRIRHPQEQGAGWHNHGAPYNEIQRGSQSNF